MRLKQHVIMILIYKPVFRIQIVTFYSMILCSELLMIRI